MHEDLEKRLAELIEQARNLPPPTEEEKRERSASWVYGQMALTRQYENATPLQLKNLRLLCRRVAGCKPERVPSKRRDIIR